MNTSAIDELLRGAAEGGVVPGVIGTVADRDGVLYEGIFGVRNIETGEPMTADTLLWGASMTKALVSVATLQLIDEGLLELEQPVADLLPAFGELQVLEGFDGDEPRLRPPVRQATIRNLLTHTSGSAYWFGNPDILRYHQVTGTPDAFTGRRVSLDVPLASDPGTRWEYGLSTDWLGLLLEAATGKDLPGLLAEQLFEPLGMSDTTFAPSEEQRARLMPVHARTPDGGLALSPIAPPSDPEFWSGGAGACLTSGDYLRFLRALLRGGELDGERILAPETVDLMFTDHLDGLEIPAFTATTSPDLICDVPGMKFAQGWGLGVHLVAEDIPQARRAGTGDWAGLANCYYWIDRASGVTGMFLTAVIPFLDQRVIETVLTYEATVYAALGAPAAA